MEEKGFEVINREREFHIRAFGKTIGDCFSHALGALGAYLKPDIALLKKGALRIKEEMRVEAVDMNSLLVAFISDALVRSEMRMMVPINITITKLGENFLEGELVGIAVERFDQEIKAVLYDAADVKKNAATGQYESVVAFEI